MRLDVWCVENGNRLYRYDIQVKNLPIDNLYVSSMQIFVAYDTNAIALNKIGGMVEWTVNEQGNKLLAVWASEQPIALNDGDVVLSLYFKANSIMQGEITHIAFTENTLGTKSSFGLVSDAGVVEYIAATEDGSILFESPAYGDANCDGKITAADAALVLRAIVGLSILTQRGAYNADVDGDCEITAADAAMILRFVVGLVNQFPTDLLD